MQGVRAYRQLGLLSLSTLSSYVNHRGLLTLVPEFFLRDKKIYERRSQHGLVGCRTLRLFFAVVASLGRTAGKWLVTHGCWGKKLEKSVAFCVLPIDDRRSRPLALVTPLPEWFDQMIAEKAGARAVTIRLRNYGVPASLADQAAEDAVQDGIQRTLAAETRFVNYEQFFHYVVSAAGNTAVDRWRRRSREEPLPGKSEQDDQFGQRPSPPECWLTLVRRIWNELPEQDQRILDLSYEDGATLNEIAAELQVGGDTPGTQRLRIWKRRRSILDKLAQWLVKAGFDPDTCVRDQR
jgi:RNA polymerase sigma factor (sigma-70 family)